MYVIWSLTLFVVSVGAIFISSAPLSAADDYNGPIFDAHSHLSNKSKPRQSYKHIIEPGFSKAAIFVDVGRVDEVLNFSKDAFLLFVDPFKRKKVKVSKFIKEVSYAFSEKRLSEIKKALQAGKVTGFGEIYFRLSYAPFTPNGLHSPIDGRGANALFDMAKAFDVPVQIHLEADYVSELEQLLKAHPDVEIVLAHCGYMQPEKLSAVMDRHANLFAETSLVFNPMIPQFANLPLEGGQLRDGWKMLMVRHSDRLMVGTDYSEFRSEQVPKLLAYYRQVLGLLPREKAEQIAYKNFERIFNK